MKIYVIPHDLLFEALIVNNRKNIPVLVELTFWWGHIKAKIRYITWHSMVSPLEKSKVRIIICVLGVWGMVRVSIEWSGHIAERGCSEHDK